MERAKEKGITITFDPNLRPALWENEEIMRNVINRMAEYADIILPGIEECRILVGTDDKKKAAEFYQACGIKTVIIKDGACLLYTSYSDPWAHGECGGSCKFSGSGHKRDVYGREFRNL